jgi:DNA-binding FrmR family transcriptional regulator
MAMHTIAGKQKLVARVRRIKGQIEAIERALEEERGCGDVLQMCAAARGALQSLVGELIEDHVRLHLVGARTTRKRRLAADELIDVVHTYMK